MTSNAKQNPDRSGGSAKSVDAFLGGRLGIAQRRSGHRGGSDAVFLAAAVPALPGEVVLDAGAGVGTAGLCLLARCSQVGVTAVEIDESQTSLAAQNATRNGFSSRFEVIAADLTAPAASLVEAGLRREGYDHVMANPPFYREGTVRAAPDAGRAAAHVMPHGELDRWVRFLTTHAAPKGTLTLIHRAECLGQILDLLADRFGGVLIYPLFPKEGAPASRIIVQGQKNNRASLRLLQGLVLHEPDGSYTAEADAVLRGGVALDLSA